MFEVLPPDDPSHIIAYPPSMLGVHLLDIRSKGLQDLPWTEEAVYGPPEQRVAVVRAMVGEALF